MKDAAQYRVRYHAGQTLRRQDFEDEQKYHSEQLRAHNTNQHRPGVLEGLNLSFDKEELRFKVQAGEAIGKDGVFIVLNKTWPIEIRAFDDKGADRLDVYLEHSDTNNIQEGLAVQSTRCQTSQADTGVRQAIKVNVATDLPKSNVKRDDAIYLGRLIRDFSSAEVSYIADSRKRENAGLVGAVIDAPTGMARIELGTHGDTEDRRFAVFLSDPQKADSCAPTSPTQENEKDQSEDPAAFEIRAAGEQYAIDLRGKTTVTGDLFVRQGMLAFQGHGDATANPAQWLVQTLRERADQSVSDLLREVHDFFESASKAAENSAGRSAEQTGDEHNGEADLQWLEKLLQGAVNLTVGQVIQKVAPMRTAPLADAKRSGDGFKTDVKGESPSSSAEDLRQIPRPWTLYRAKSPIDVSNANQEGSDQVPIEQLRVELDSTQESAFVVGSMPADGEEFESILTVTSKPATGGESLGQVVVKGDLIVEGRIDGEREEPPLSDRARELLFSGALLGPQNVDDLIEAFERTGFLSEVQAISGLADNTPAEKLQPFINAALEGKDNGLEAVANAIRDAVVDETDAAKLGLVAKAIFGKKYGTEGIANELPDDQVKLKKLAGAILGLRNGVDAIATQLPNDQDKLEKIAKAMLALSLGDDAIANELPDDLAKLKKLGRAILGLGNGVEAIATQLPNDQDKLEKIAKAMLALSLGDDAIANELPDDLAKLKKLGRAILGLGNGVEAIATQLPNDQDKLEKIAKAMLALSLGDDAIANELPDDLAKLKKLGRAILGLGNGVEAIATQLPNDQDKLEKIAKAMLALSLGDDAIANELPDDLAKLKKLGRAILGLGNGVEAIATQLPNDQDKLEKIAKAMLALSLGDDAIANELPDDLAKLKKLGRAILGLGNGVEAIATQLPNDQDKLEKIAKAMLALSLGDDAIANELPDDLAKLKTIAEELLKKDNGAIAVVTKGSRRKAIIRGFIEHFEVGGTAPIPPRPVRPLAKEIVEVDKTSNNLWATSLRDELSEELR